MQLQNAGRSLREEGNGGTEGDVRGEEDEAAEEVGHLFI